MPKGQKEDLLIPGRAALGLVRKALRGPKQSCYFLSPHYRALQIYKGPTGPGKLEGDTQLESHLFMLYSFRITLMVGKELGLTFPFLGPLTTGRERGSTYF